MPCTAQTITITSPSTRAKELALSARRLLEDLKELEVGMMTSTGWQEQCPRRTPSIPPSSIPRRSLPCRSSSTSSNHQRFLACQFPLDHSTSTMIKCITDEKRVSGAFVTFCDHLLYMNHIWKQERQLRSLQASLRAVEKAKCSNAFKGFCDRLLLSNRVWQLERQIRDLTAEGERNKRDRAAAISHAAKRMAVDVRKEAMIEEFVIELTQELQEGKEAIFEMKKAHEREMREVQGDWLREYRRLARENEQLQLERWARLMEQEVSNELEQSLSDAVERSQERIKELEYGDGESTLVGDAFDHGSALFSGSSSSVDETEVEVDEDLSTMSPATYASFHDVPNWPTKYATSRRSRHSHVGNSKSLDAMVYKKRLSRRQSMPLRTLETTPYTGFSFNPLFFGHPEALVVSPSRTENSETPVKVKLRLGSSVKKTSVRERRDSTTSISRPIGPTEIREPWRF